MWNDKAVWKNEMAPNSSITSNDTVIIRHSVTQPGNLNLKDWSRLQLDGGLLEVGELTVTQGFITVLNNSKIIVASNSNLENWSELLLSGGRMETKNFYLNQGNVNLGNNSNLFVQNNMTINNWSNLNITGGNLKTGSLLANAGNIRIYNGGTFDTEQNADFRNWSNLDIQSGHFSADALILNTGNAVISYGTATIRSASLLNHSRIAVNDGSVLYIGSVNNQPYDPASPPSGIVRAGTGQVNPAPLPVELLYFKSTSAGGGRIILEFATAAEINNDYFAIERSDDGRNFETIHEQPGTNQKDVRVYTYTDAFPLAGINYYRLRQVDFDGTTTYSKIISAQNHTLEMLVGEQVRFTAPVTGVLQILTPTGAKVYEKELVSEQQVALPFLNTNGVYIFKAAVNGQAFIQKVARSGMQ